MIRIGICDDDIVEQKKIYECCMAYAALHPKYNFDIKVFSDAASLISSTENNKSFDILMLDIYMPKMTGIELAHSLRKQNSVCEIIFLTSSEKHAIEAFTLNATHYILKPYTHERFDQALSKAIFQLKKLERNQITLKTTNGVHNVKFSDFLYAESNGHVQDIYCLTGRKLSVRITATELYNRVAHDHRFHKFGSTYIINLKMIKEITNNYILLENNEQLRMQRRQYKRLVDDYTKYSLEGN